MNKTQISVLILILYFAQFVIIIQVIISVVNDYLNKLVKDAAKSLKEKVDGDIKDIPKKYLDNLRQEVANIKLVELKKETLILIPRYIGFAENIFFVALTILLLINNGNEQNWFIKNIIEILKIAGTWIALKIIGSYQQWSGAVFGRANFYVFFICSVFNIILSILFGILMYRIYLIATM